MRVNHGGTGMGPPSGAKRSLKNPKAWVGEPLFGLLLSGVALEPARANQNTGFCPVLGAIQYPIDGQTVATNANVHLYTTYGGVISDGVALAVDGEVVPHVRTDYQASPNASYSAASLAPVQDYPAGAVVSLLVGGDEQRIAFDVGDYRDEEPPSWDGTVTVFEEKGTRQDGCDRLFLHGFAFEGVTDDHTEYPRMLAVGEPDVGDQGFAGPLATEVSLRGDGCPGDASLPSTFDRVYTVRFIDGAGNVSDPYEVEVGSPRVCGCRVERSTRSTWSAFPHLSVSRRSRRRPALRGTDP